MFAELCIAKGEKSIVTVPDGDAICHSSFNSRKYFILGDLVGGIYFALM